MSETDNRPTVPRDKAFWNTYDDVAAEQAAAFARIECRRMGHIMVDRFRRDGTAETVCSRCGTDWNQFVTELSAQGHRVAVDEGCVSIEFHGGWL